MKDGSGSGRRGGEGRDVCVGGLGYAPRNWGEAILEGEGAGKGVE